MSVNAKIIAALKPLNIPVNFMEHAEGSEAYIVFNTYKAKKTGFADDKSDFKNHFIALDFWYSKPAHFSMINQIDELMEANEFVYQGDSDAPLEDGHYCRHYDYVYTEYLQPKTGGINNG